MIIEKIMLFWQSAFFTIFNFIDLPDLPVTLSDSLNEFLDLVFTNISALGFFVRISTLSIIIPLAILIINFDKIYDLVMWVLRKIPVLRNRLERG